jgi:hypothetical protein
MKKQKYMVCRDCDIEFDTTLAENRKGYANQCGECCEISGDTQDKVKAITRRSSNGDFIGIDVVSKDEFSKYTELEKETGSLLNGR